MSDVLGLAHPAITSKPTATNTRSLVFIIAQQPGWAATEPRMNSVSLTPCLKAAWKPVIVPTIVHWTASAVFQHRPGIAVSIVGCNPWSAIAT